MAFRSPPQHRSPDPPRRPRSFDARGKDGTGSALSRDGGPDPGAGEGLRKALHGLLRGAEAGGRRRDLPIGVLGGKDMADPTYEWRFDPRLNIDRLILHVDPDRLTQEEKTELALRYQEMAAQIPAQVKAFEKRYMACYEELKQAEDDETFRSEYSEEKTWQILPMNGVSIPASTSIA